MKSIRFPFVVVLTKNPSKVWDKVQFICRQSIDHGSAVNNLLISGHMIFSASNDAMKVWPQSNFGRCKEGYLVTRVFLSPTVVGRKENRANEEASNYYIRRIDCNIERTKYLHCEVVFWNEPRAHTANNWLH